MKKWVVYLLGVLTGVILTVLVLFVLYQASDPMDHNITWFEQPGDIVKEKGFEVFQVLDDNAALAFGEGDMRVTYVVYNNDGKFYYDGEVVKIPEGKVARQYGIYRYQNREQMEKTVPIVRIVDK